MPGEPGFHTPAALASVLSPQRNAGHRLTLQSVHHAVPSAHRLRVWPCVPQGSCTQEPLWPGEGTGSWETGGTAHRR